MEQTSSTDPRRGGRRRAIGGKVNGEMVLGFYQRFASALLTRVVKSSFADFGRHSKIAPSLRLSGAGSISVGSGVYVGAGSWLQVLGGEQSSVAIRLGDRVSIAGSVTVSARNEVVIEDAVIIARGVYISDHRHSWVDTSVPIKDQGICDIRPVRIGRGAWLGQNAVVMPGVTVGEGAVVGANSVVTKDVPPFSVVVGAPARVIRTVAAE